MFESNVMWIETVTQLLIVVPFCFLMEKSVGFKRIWKNIPAWLPVGILYTSWNIYNIIVVRYPHLLTGTISQTTAYGIRAISGLVLMFIILPCFYKGGMVERYFAAFLLEEVSLFAGLLRYACMMLIKNSWFYDRLEQKIILLLVFRIFIEYMPYYFFYFVFRKRFDNYHDLVRMHKKICCAAVVLIIVLETIFAFISGSKEFQEFWRVIAGTLFLFAVVGVTIYLLKKENERIYLQKQLMENHYQFIKGQEEQITAIQSEIGRLLEAAEAFEKQIGYKEEDLKYYEEELKKIHSKLQRVDYCDNLMLDAVLHNKAKECEEKNIKLDIQMNNVNLWAIRDIDIFEIVYEMLEIAICYTTMQEDEALKRITISGKNLAGQVVIETVAPKVSKKQKRTVKENRKRYSVLKRKVKKLKGQCVISTKENTESIISGIPCE